MRASALEKYTDGMKMDKLKHLPDISCYNNNYYVGHGKDLLFAQSDDDDMTHWYLISGTESLFVGHSFIRNGEKLERASEPFC